MKSDGAPALRSYDDSCGAAYGLSLVGDRWTLLVARELMLGPRRFSDLRAGLGGISANVLTQKLRRGLDVGMFQRRRLPPPAASWIYELTEWGLAAEPILQELGRWSVRHPDYDPSAPLSPVSFMLSLRTLFVSARAPGRAIAVNFIFGEECYRCELLRKEISVTRAEERAADVTVRTDPNTAAFLVHHSKGLPSAADVSDSPIEGSIACFREFASAFEMPQISKSFSASARIAE
ncbi:helix-turn-helix transcriptional regulator [Qipengyuania sp. 6B39]|uniref:winged helix-turn-helix transcriptional regulator n=1 Tax=Qipengyuania proteolytica TaxID=2867239 RepID=UPI001C8A9B2F|nr:helix-turn-helix transcriptional regulator [Qipengyuania proteolytica]